MFSAEVQGDAMYGPAQPNLNPMDVLSLTIVDETVPNVEVKAGAEEAIAAIIAAASPIRPWVGVRIPKDALFEAVAGYTVEIAPQTSNVSVFQVDDGDDSDLGIGDWGRDHIVLRAQGLEADTLAATATITLTGSAVGPSSAVPVGSQVSVDVAEIVFDVTVELAEPDPPQNLTATPGDEQLHFGWEHSGGVRSRYETRLDAGDWETRNANATGARYTGLTNGTDYVFEIRAVNAAGMSEAASIKAAPVSGLQVPGMPENLTAMGHNESVALAWEAPSSGGAPSGYEYRQVEGDLGSEWAATSSHTGHTVTDLTNGTEYTFEVRAVNDAGEGPPASAKATPTADPPDLPGVPRSLTWEPGDGQVTLSWMAPAGGGAVASYQYDMNASGDWMDAGTGLTTTVTGLTNGTSYVFRVRAVNVTGASDATGGVTAIPSAGLQVVVKSVTADSTTVAESGGLTVTGRRDGTGRREGGRRQGGVPDEAALGLVPDRRCVDHGRTRSRPG